MSGATISAAVISENSIKKYYRIDRREIHYLKFVLEGYAGMAVMRTLDPVDGVILLLVSPGCEKEVDAVIRSLQEEILIEERGPVVGEFL